MPTSVETVKSPLGFVFATLLASSTALAADPSPAPDIHLPVKLEAGIWDADVTFFENDQPSGQAKGVQTNTLLANGHWITNDFSIPATGKFPAYQGHGVWGYDPVAKAYVNTWVDTNDQAVRTDYGYWQVKTQTMWWSSKQNDGNGHFVDYRMSEEFKGESRIFTFYRLGIVKPESHPLVRIVFTRRQAPAAAVKP